MVLVPKSGLLLVLQYMFLIIVKVQILWKVLKKDVLRFDIENYSMENGNLKIKTSPITFLTVEICTNVINKNRAETV